MEPKRPLERILTEHQTHLKGGDNKIRNCRTRIDRASQYLKEGRQSDRPPGALVQEKVQRISADGGPRRI